MRLTLFILSFWGSYLCAQPSIQWQKTFGGTNYEQAIKVVQQGDSTYSIICYTLSNDGDVVSNHGGRDFWLINLGSNGDLIGQKALGGSAEEFPFDMNKTSDGGLIIAGYSMSDDGDLTENHGEKDAWIVKLDATGNIVWQRSFGGSYSDIAYSICETDDGYVFAGETYSNTGDFSMNHGVTDFWIVKLDKNGNQIWQKLLGGSNSEKASRILQTSDNGFIVVGETQSNDGDVSGNHGNFDYWVVKINADGNLEWQKCFGGIAWDTATGVVESNGYYISGEAASGNTGDISGHHGSFDQWILKIDYSGELVWQKPLGGSKQDYAYDGIQLEGQSYLAIGATNSKDGDISTSFGSNDLWITLLDSSGNLIRQNSIGGSKSDLGNSILKTSDNYFITVGGSESSDGGVPANKGKTDAWIVKLSPSNTPTLTPTLTQLTLYPNPTSQQITLQTPDNEPITSIQTTDLSGKTLKTEQAPQDKTLQVTMLPKGMYLLKATSASGKVFCGKFVKE